MIRPVALFMLCASLFFSPTARADKDLIVLPKLKAVIYVGGGFHDYKKRPVMLAEKIGALANVDIDIKLMNTAEEMATAFKDPKFGEGYDVILYDICFGEKWNDGDYDGA